MSLSNTQNEYESAQNITDSILKEVESGGNPTLKTLLETAVNIVMRAERNQHTSGNPDDKANGYYSRELGTPLGSLALQVPRDRDGDFRPAVLPQPHQRDCDARYDLLQALLINSYSPNAILRTLHELNMHYSAKELANLKEEIMAEFSVWQNRELPEDIIGLFIDVYCAEAQIDNKVRKVALYVIVGIDFSGKKSLYGLYLCEGNESKTYWLQVLNQICHRGVKRPLYVISDDFPGLKEAVSTVFPKAFHQLCLVHMHRNISRNMGKEDAKVFNEDIKQIRMMKTAEQAEEKFKSLCEDYQERYPAYIESLMKDTKNYFAYLHLPKESQKHFYSTNIVESVNSLLEKMRVRMGGFFQSEKALFVNVYITFRGLDERKWQHGLPMVKGYLYEIKQLFVRAYGDSPKDDNTS